MMGWILRLVLSGLSLLFVDWLLESVTIDGFGVALLAAFILGLVNAIIRPVLVFLTMPITFVTLGLFLLVINAFTYWLTAALIPGFEVTSFWGAIVGSMITSIVTWILHGLTK